MPKQSAGVEAKRRGNADMAGKRSETGCRLFPGVSAFWHMVGLE
ncbi:hypothetical protein GCM10023228_36490 [Brevibacillus fulvus]